MTSKEDVHGAEVLNLQGRRTFVPFHLPGPLKLDWELASILNEAERALGQLIGVGRTLPNPQIAVRSFVRLEAQLSSRIENTHAELADLALFEESPNVEERVPDVREVRNNERAIMYGIESVLERGRKLGLPLIKEMHQLLLADVRGAQKNPGRFRRIQVMIGRSANIEEARFVPPPPEKVPELMESLADYMQSKSDLPVIARAAMIHYQFEAIHPFEDGNGRIGRVLILLFLCAQGSLPLPLLNPSAYLETNRSEYYDRLLEVSTRGRWAEWVKFFTRGIAATANDAVDRLDRLKGLQADYHARLQKAKASALSLRLVDELFVHHAITTARAAERLGITYAGAQRNVDRLLAAGILHEITGQKRNRVYLASGILEAIHGKKAE
jgi:Fic family protein